MIPTADNHGTARPSSLNRYSARQNHHRVDFFCRAPAAKQVDLVGDFNRWQAAACSMQRLSDGSWTASLELSHGYHQYYFLVDGKAVLDPHSAGTTRNERNERASLIAVS
jgi:1,4-alpha-glucan branching enzyme